MRRFLIILCVGFAIGVTSCAAYYDDLGTLEEINNEMVRGDEFADMFEVDGEAFFPIGIYAGRADDFSSLPEVHFNIVVAFLNEKNIEQAKTNSLKICPEINSYKPDILTNKINTYLENNDILFWYISDEPDYHGVSANVMNEAYKTVKKLDTDRSIFQVLSPAGDQLKYLNSTDIVGTDIYPIPHSEVIEVYKEILHTKIRINNSKPIIPVLQAFPWGSNRPPTSREIRAMVFLSLVSGVQGIFYFGLQYPQFGENGWYLLKQKSLWLEIADINKTLHEFKDFFIQGINMNKYISVNNRKVKFKLLCRNKKCVLFTINSTEETQEITYKVESSVIKPVIEDEHGEILNASLFTKKYNAFESQIYYLNTH